VEAWHGERSPTRSGSAFGRICPVRCADPGAAGRAPTPASVSRGSGGSSGRGRRGVNCPPVWQPHHLLAAPPAVGRQRRAAGAVARVPQLQMRGGYKGPAMRRTAGRPTARAVIAPEHVADLALIFLERQPETRARNQIT